MSNRKNNSNYDIDDDDDICTTLQRGYCDDSVIDAIETVDRRCNNNTSLIDYSYADTIAAVWHS